jgi:thiol-disulfide isomerase/thioredoxin
MKITKSQRSNIIFIGVLGILFFTPLGSKVKEISTRLLSFSPSVESVESRDQLVDYTWKLKGINAEDYDFSEANGKVVVLNFWATWCPPCRAEMPSLQNLYADYKDKVVFLFLTNEEDAVVNKFLDKYDYTIPSFNQYSKTPNNFSVSSIPATYVLDKDGFIVIDKVGPALWDSDKVRKLLDELLMK